MAPESTTERKLPTLEEFAEFLFRDGSNQAEHAKRRLLVEYSAIWAAEEGLSYTRALTLAHSLADRALLTSEELLAEEQR